MRDIRARVITWASKKYGVKPDNPFASSPDSLVLRHGGTGKWFALFMEIPAEKLGLHREGTVQIVNLKCDPMLSGSIRDGTGVFPAYHMSHSEWISVLLDGTVDIKDVRALVDMSWSLTSGGPGRRGGRITKWLIPANPAYYDIDAGLAESGGDTLYWKQGRGIRAGDTVYIYVAAPVCAVRYKCQVLEANIPREYRDENVTMRYQMLLRFLQRYDTVSVDRSVLAKFGVHAVRGPRSMPEALAKELEKYEKNEDIKK